MVVTLIKLRIITGLMLVVKVYYQMYHVYHVYHEYQVYQVNQLYQVHCT